MENENIFTYLPVLTLSPLFNSAMVMVSPVSREMLATAGKQSHLQQRVRTPTVHGSAQPYPEAAQAIVGLH